MITTGNNDAPQPASKKTCACIEGCDARECLLRRSPQLRRRSDESGGLDEEYMDATCECHCHVEEADEYREDWEDRP